MDKIAKAVFISCPEITEHRILVTGRVDTRDGIYRESVARCDREEMGWQTGQQCGGTTPIKL